MTAVLERLVTFRVCRYAVPDVGQPPASCSLASLACAGCDILTDAPLTDSEMSDFLAEADSRATRSRGQAYQETVAAAAAQRSTIAGALSLSRSRSDATAEAKALATRAGAIAGELSEAESSDLGAKKSALDQAIQGDDVDAITTALTDLRHAVAAAESAISSRRSSTGQDHAAPPTEEGSPGATGGGETGESAETGQEEGRPGEESESHSQIGAPSDTDSSSAQDSAEPAQAPLSPGEQSQEP